MTPPVPIRPQPEHKTLEGVDISYVQSHYQSLSDSCSHHNFEEERIREQIDQGLLPRPTYLLGNEEMVPYDYFLLLQVSGSVEDLKPLFYSRYYSLAKVYPEFELASHADSAYNGYLSGGFGACLWNVTPENILLKKVYMARIETLLANPNEDNSKWRDSLRYSVGYLDSLERPFASADRERFGGDVSRDRLISLPKRRYPQVFE